MGIRESFRELRQQDKLYDVTIIPDDGKHLPAHKAILSASSYFLHNILSKIDQCISCNTYIYVKGVNSHDLSSVINFIYNGETMIDQDNLQAFLKTAQELHIKGIDADLQALESTVEKNAKHSSAIIDHRSSSRMESNGVQNLIDAINARTMNSYKGRDLSAVEVNLHTIQQKKVTHRRTKSERNEDVWNCGNCGNMFLRHAHYRLTDKCFDS